MFAVTVTLRIHPGQMSDFLPLMRENAQMSRSTEPDCHQFDVCHNEADGTVFLYELYTDAAAFETHLATAHFQDFDTATKDMIAEKHVATFAKVIQ